MVTSWHRGASINISEGGGYQFTIFIFKIITESSRHEADLKTVQSTEHFEQVCQRHVKQFVFRELNTRIWWVVNSVLNVGGFELVDQVAEHRQLALYYL